jgi:aldose 1-epimerase
MIKTEKWGTLPCGKEVFLYTLSNTSGAYVKITNFGGIVTECWVADKNGKLEDVVLGYDSLDEYIKGDKYFGAICGRYANRINKGKFTLDGKEYTLAINNGPNALHGGLEGFNQKAWTGSIVQHNGAEALELTLLSPDMQEGYPGNLNVRVIYSFTEANELCIEYEAITDKKTVLNLTNHSYFNLNACKSSVLEHVLTLNADKYTETDDTLIPSGKTPEVTPALDFRKPKTIGKDIAASAYGYDDNLLVNGYDATLRKMVELTDPSNGRVLEMFTTEPGTQLYSAYWIDGTVGKKKITYKSFYGICFEAQHFADSPNHDNFPTTVLNPGEVYKQKTVYKFSVK